jgi:hypothetical protein
MDISLVDEEGVIFTTGLKWEIIPVLNDRISFEEEFYIVTQVRFHSNNKETKELTTVFLHLKRESLV